MHRVLTSPTAQKMKFFIKNFFSKCDQLRSFLFKEDTRESIYDATCYNKSWGYNFAEVDSTAVAFFSFYRMFITAILKSFYWIKFWFIVTSLSNLFLRSLIELNFRSSCSECIQIIYSIIVLSKYSFSIIIATLFQSKDSII